MTPSIRRPRHGLALLLSLALTACGGGGGGSSDRDLPATPATSTPQAVTLARAGWSEALLYNHPLDYPQAVTLDENGDIVVYSRGNRHFVKYDSTGSLSLLFDASAYSNLTAIGYQPNAARVVFVANGQLYGLSGGTASAIGSPSVALGVSGAIAVDPSDDSFYACSPQASGAIYRFSASGALQATLADNVHGCFAIAYDPAANTLYYSETYDGEINALDLTNNNQVSVIASGVGIPGTYEPIAVALDAAGTLYSFPSASGLYRYDGGASWTKVVDPIAGAGPLLWYPKGNTFVTGNGVGANLSAYDPAGGLTGASHLTQYVNATGLAELGDGTVLLCDWNLGQQLMAVTATGLAPYGNALGKDCNALEHDDNGTVYVGMTDGTLGTITAGGNVSGWSTAGPALPVIRMAYDAAGARLLVIYGDEGSDTAYLYAFPVATPASPALVDTFVGVTTGGGTPAVAADSSGNAYVLERAANVIYRIDATTSARTTFASSVLESEAITVPDIEFVAAENGLLVSTIGDYQLWPLAGGAMSVFGTNVGGVDNFAVNQAPDGSLLAVHSGQVFRMSYTTP